MDRFSGYNEKEVVLKPGTNLKFVKMKKTPTGRIYMTFEEALNMSKNTERAKRMVDVGMEEAKTSFELGAEPSEEEVQAVLDAIEDMDAEEFSPED